MKDGYEKGKTKKKQNGTAATAPALLIVSAFVVIGGIIVFIFLLSLICLRRDVIRDEAVDAAGEGNDDDHVISERTGYMDAGAVDRKSVCGCGGPQGIREDSSELSVSCLNRVACGPNIFSRPPFRSFATVESRTRVLALQRTRLKPTGLACMDIYFNK